MAAKKKAAGKVGKGPVKAERQLSLMDVAPQPAPSPKSGRAGREVPRPATQGPAKAEKAPRGARRGAAPSEPELPTLSLETAAADGDAGPEAAPGKASRGPKRRATAEQMATKQREISISEFFTKNRHLLGFDNPSKALLTTIKEAVDNSLDACEEAGILPELTIEVRDLAWEKSAGAEGRADEPGPERHGGRGGAVPPAEKAELTKGEGRFVVVVEDNGPGIVKAQVPKIFGKLLYGSKFHRLKQSRGQQGIGISAAAMYGQLTTGRPIRVTSRTGKGKPAHVFEIQIDTRKNNPTVMADEELGAWHQEHGTRVELEIVADWRTGQRFVNRYVEHTALANPHATVHYVRPRAEKLTFPRATEELPKEALEIKPHPHGVELGALMLMASESKSHDVKGFMQTAFSRVSGQVASEILKNAGLKERLRPRAIGEDRALAEKLHKGILATRIMAPSTGCLSPIGDELMKRGLVSFLSVIESEGPEQEDGQLDLDSAGKRAAAKKVAGRRAKAQPNEAGPEQAGGAGGAVPPAEMEGVEKIKGHDYFIATVTRPPKVYRGNPFQVEVGLAYGGSWPADKTIELFRFANRVPLLFQRGACGMTEAIVKTDWRNYLLSQPKGSLPVGPMALLVHIASVWVPFTSEAKEALAHYPEIGREIQLAAQECGRKLATFIRKKKHADYQAQRRSIFELYIQEVSQALGKITGKSPEPIKRDFLKVANQVTETELAEADAALEEASKKITKAPRKSRGEDEQE